MNNKTEAPQKNTGQEVDFEPLIAWFLNKINALGRFLKLVLLSFVSHWKILTTLFLVGFAAGVAVYFTAEKVYLSKALIRVSDISNKTCYNAVQILGELIEDESYQTVAEVLNIDLDQAEALEAISYINIYGQGVKQGDTIAENQDFFIQLETTNKNGFSLYEASLVQYLNGLPLTSEEFNKRRNLISQDLENLQYQLLELDSLKKTVEQSFEYQRKGNGLIFGQPINPIVVHKESERVHSAMVRLEQELKIVKSIKLVIPFIKNDKPIFPRFRHIAMVSGIFLILGWVVAFIKTVKEM
jgi:hypothetical protein